uniref:Uncharacterized protein n=1 Tax=viral metagenome TaxID=1070528 RepID=A0A6M3LF03_9ZZZZ
MNEKKFLKDINKWRKKEKGAQKKLRDISERLALAKASYIVYMGNQCPYYVEAPDNLRVYKEAFNE